MGDNPALAQLEAVWAACDYTPTARKLAPASVELAGHIRAAVPAGSEVVEIGAGQGGLTALLGDAGYRVTAVEPVAAIADTGRSVAPDAQWVLATGEATTLADGCCDAVVSSFASMLCPVAEGVAEWARILRPGGLLLMATWNGEGFMAEMTRRMMPGAAELPPNLRWGEAKQAREWLEPSFAEVQVERRSLDWSFDSVDEGMAFYAEGSPVHAFMLRGSGDAALADRLRNQLEDATDADGRVRASASYSLITARRY